MDQTSTKPCFDSIKLHFPFLMEVHFLNAVLFIICRDAVRSTVECPTRWSTKQCLGESFILLISYGLYDMSHAIFHACFFSNWFFFPDPCIKFYNLMTVYFILLILVIVFMNGSIIYIMSDRPGIHGPWSSSVNDDRHDDLVRESLWKTSRCQLEYSCL